MLAFDHSVLFVLIKSFSLSFPLGVFPPARQTSGTESSAVPPPPAMAVGFWRETLEVVHARTQQLIHQKRDGNPQTFGGFDLLIKKCG
jgi:hypothetical protein